MSHLKPNLQDRRCAKFVLADWKGAWAVGILNYARSDVVREIYSAAALEAFVCQYIQRLWKLL